MSKKEKKDMGKHGSHARLRQQRHFASNAPGADSTHQTRSISHEDYDGHLHLLQMELVKLQRYNIRHQNKILILLEGRDAAGKDGSIKRIVENLSPRETRIVALGAPSDRERSAWYFQRYVAQLPVAGELVLFNRSWYNRAGVEHVMGFCSKDEYEPFLQSVPKFEEMLIHSGIQLLKYYLDISKDEQKRRLADRARDPLKQWKSSPIDAVAIKHWKSYSSARDAMVLRTHTDASPWTIVSADNKLLARLNLMRDILSRVHYAGKKETLVRPDRDIVFEFTPECIGAEGLAP
jgi:polyphosphate kinase 2